LPPPILAFSEEESGFDDGDEDGFLFDCWLLDGDEPGCCLFAYGGVWVGTEGFEGLLFGLDILSLP
jgi:hypothetical protein